MEVNRNKDFKELVSLLMKEDVFSKKPGRCFASFPDMDLNLYPTVVATNVRSKLKHLTKNISVDSTASNMADSNNTNIGGKNFFPYTNQKRQSEEDRLFNYIITEQRNAYLAHALDCSTICDAHDCYFCCDDNVSPLCTNCVSFARLN